MSKRHAKPMLRTLKALLPHRPKSEMKRRTGVGWVCWGLMAAFTLTLIVASVQYISYVAENMRSERLAAELLEIAITQQSGENLAPIAVDFDALKAKNPDIVAWVYCPDTDINYPVLQSSDNKYYLRRGADGTSRVAGSIFADFRNTADLSDENNIIYGHNMTDGSMFGTLKKYADQSYYDDHPVWYLLTPERDYKVMLFAAFVTDTSSPVYATARRTTADGTPIMEQAWADSNFRGGPPPAEGERTVTFSTCSYEFTNARYVLIGVLHELGKAASAE